MCYTNIIFIRGKRIGKKGVKLIINHDTNTSIDIHSKADLKLADFIVKQLKNKKNLDNESKIKRYCNWYFCI